MGAVNAAQITVVRQYLGLDYETLAWMLDINERSLRRYEAESATMNPAVGQRLEDLVRVADAEVEAMVAELVGQEHPVITVYREAGEMHALAPADPPPISPGWRRAIVGRVITRLPGAVVDYPPKRTT